MFKITNNREFYECLYAFCMGDGGVYRHKHKGKHIGNAKFIANNIADNEDYIYARADVLSQLTTTKVIDVTKYRDCKDGYTRKSMLRTETKTHPTYTKIWNRLYSTGRKGVDPHQLKFMSWQFLAILYQDDGNCTVDNRCNATPIAQIATKSFTYPENMAIKLAIKEKLDIEFNLRRQTYNDRIYWFLVLPVRFYDKFRYGVEPYIFDSFRYKIPENTNTSTKQIS
jgi:hypothetical protein